MTQTILETMKQALDALEREMGIGEEIDNLRAAIKAMEDAEPVKCRYCGQDTMHTGDVCYSCNNPAPAVPDYRAIADAVVDNLEGRKQVIDLDLEEELVEEIMQEMADTIRDGLTHPIPTVTNQWEHARFIQRVLESAHPTDADKLEALRMVRELRNPAPAVPEGWQLVPKEPTEKMGDYGMSAGAKSSFAAHMIYRHMLSAAPKLDNTQCAAQSADTKSPK